MDTEFFSLPVDFIKQNHKKTESGWEKVNTRKLDLDQYSGERGFELIAKALDIPYPFRETTEPNQAVEPTLIAVTDRAPSSTLRASHARL